MIKVAVVDDEAKARNTVRECLSFVAEKERVDFKISEFCSGLSFLGEYKPVYDIVLLDIEMPEADGLEIARMLRKMDKSVIIIFVTNMAQYAVKGYEVEALDFIVKPVNKYGFAMKMSRAIARTAKRVEDSVPIKTDGEVFSVQISSIKYLEVNEHYIIYHTTDGEYSECITLKNAENKINKDFFVRCNRCYLVNLRYVSYIKGLSVFVGNDELIISRPQKSAFVSAYLKFISGGTN